MDTQFTLKLGGLDHPQIISLLEEHLSDMQATSPPESKHALDIDGLKLSSIQFFSLWDAQTLAGFAAYKKLNAQQGEIKSMRTAKQYRGQGVASILLEHIIQSTKQSGFSLLSLETGSMAYFKPARKFYAKHGFCHGAPFSDYSLDPNSVFMHKNLD